MKSKKKKESLKKGGRLEEKIDEWKKNDFVGVCVKIIMANKKVVFLAIYTSMHLSAFFTFVKKNNEIIGKKEFDTCKLRVVVDQANFSSLQNPKFISIRILPLPKLSMYATSIGSVL